VLSERAEWAGGERADHLEKGYFECQEENPGTMLLWDGQGFPVFVTRSPETRIRALSGFTNGILLKRHHQERAWGVWDE
jgi:hypothetical protein